MTDQKKTFINLSDSIMEAITKAKTHEDKVNLLYPLAVAVMWDRGELSDQGFNRQQHARYTELHAKISSKIGSFDMENIKGDALAKMMEDEGVRSDFEEALSLWKETAAARAAVQKYIAEKEEESNASK